MKIWASWWGLLPLLLAVRTQQYYPSVEVAAKIAEALDVSLDYLAGNFTVILKDKK